MKSSEKVAQKSEVRSEKSSSIICANTTECDILFSSAVELSAA